MRYEQEKGASLAENSLNATITAFNHVERAVGPDKLASLTSSVLSQFQSELRKEGMRETTIATHLRHLRAALSWAVAVELLPKAPDLHMPRRPRGQTLMRGRPVTVAEFHSMLARIIHKGRGVCWKERCMGRGGWDGSGGGVESEPPPDPHRLGADDEALLDGFRAAVIRIPERVARGRGSAG